MGSISSCGLGHQTPHPAKEAAAAAQAKADAIQQPPWFDEITAARDMAALILAANPQLSTLNPQPFCWLVPIPDSDSSTRANAILAAHIARHVVRRAGVPPASPGGEKKRKRGQKGSVLELKRKGKGKKKGLGL